MSLLSSYITDLFQLLSSCLSCFGSSAQLKINKRSFRILRLLGEGGFSYVYLVQELSGSRVYALKKIRCPFGQESVAQALKEVEAYTLFAPHANIIHSIDHSVASDKNDASAKTVYILLPYFRNGNLQDAINANLVNGTSFPQKKLLRIFLGVCRGLKAMHQYRVKSGSSSSSEARARRVRDEAAGADEDAAEQARRQGGGGGRGDGADGDVEQEQEPLMQDEVTQSQEGYEAGEVRAYAHRDVKPGNIMLADDNTTPILMDLGSLAPSPIPITSRSLALAVQDTAAEHSTMPYRAPELFDVKTDSVIDTKVDIWSMGCTLYACLVGRSPFEARSEETGGSLSLCVLGGDWRFPDEGPQRGKDGKNKKAGVGGGSGNEIGNGGRDKLEIDGSVRELVRKCLRVEPSERPDVDELIAMVEEVIEELSGDEGG